MPKSGRPNRKVKGQKSVNWTTKPVDRSGLSAYLHLIRAPDDPKEITRAERKAAGIEPTTWQRELGPESYSEWLEDFMKLMADGQARTFNRMMVEASMGRWTADRAAGKAPDKALWELVHTSWLEHTLETPVLFRKKDEQPQPRQLGLFDNRGGKEDGKHEEEAGP